MPDGQLVMADQDKCALILVVEMSGEVRLLPGPINLAQIPDVLRQIATNVAVELSTVDPRTR